MLFKDDSFRKWAPLPMLDSVYDIGHVAWTGDRIALELVPDHRDPALRSRHRILLTWEEPYLYQLSRQRLRTDCRLAEGQEHWSLFESRESAGLQQLKARDRQCPEGAIHFLVAGTNLVADIISGGYPMAEVRWGTGSDRRAERAGAGELPSGVRFLLS